MKAFAFETRNGKRRWGFGSIKLVIEANTVASLLTQARAAFKTKPFLLEVFYNPERIYGEPTLSLHSETLP